MADRTPAVRRVAVILGTRPEAIKLAPVIVALRGDDRFQTLVVNTGQHSEMVMPIMDIFGIRVDHDLAIGGPDQTLADITVRALSGLDRMMTRMQPDVVLVQGDTSTSFAGALASYYHKTPVAHVEAGLRTGDPYAPFPEELNRRMTAALASLHLAPTPGNVHNLMAEGIDREAIVCTGNTVIDALRLVLAQHGTPLDPDAAEIVASGVPVLLVTVHRRESWGEPLARVANALAQVAAAHPGVMLVVPAHPNPKVRQALAPIQGLRNVRVLEPLDYRSFAMLLSRSALVLTDSGGIQEEAPSLGVPVLVLREVTERPEAVASGSVEIIGTDPVKIVERSAELLADAADLESQPAGTFRMTRRSPYGDGHASERVVAAVAHLFGEGPPATEFVPDSKPAGSI